MAPYAPISRVLLPEEEHRKCPVCKKEISKSATTCPYCGASLLERVELRQEPPSPEPVIPLDSSLLEQYRVKYPHSPEGVLEFHIARLRREGKTRREAMLELKKRLGIA